MLRRTIQSIIVDYLTNGSNKILIVNGARQIGKSYIIRNDVVFEIEKDAGLGY